MRLLAGLLLGVVLALTGGCADLKQVYDAATTSAVPSKTVIAAVSAFNTTQTLATAYIRYCTPAPQPTGCDDAAIRKIIANMPTWRRARDDAFNAAVKNRDGVVPGAVYDEVRQAATDIRAIVDQYNMASVVPTPKQ